MVLLRRLTFIPYAPQLMEMDKKNNVKIIENNVKTGI